MRKTVSGSAGTGARGAGGIKSNRREGEGQRGSSGDTTIQYNTQICKAHIVGW